MSLLYVPIMAAKRGEFTALANLEDTTAKRILPLFNVPNPGDGKPIEKTIARTAVGAGKAWFEREAFLDVTKWKSNAVTESGIHVFEFAFTQFRLNGVTVHPVAGYDRWDDPVYVQALKNIRTAHAVKICIRLDSDAIEDMGDLEYFEERIQNILTDLDVSTNNCYVLIDLEDVSKATVPDVLEKFEGAIDVIRSMGFTTIILAGSSMPTGINEAVESTDTAGCIPRIEAMSWKAIFSARTDRNVIFGDYLIRNPNAPDGVIAPHANAKIRYTIGNQFYIVRGHSKKQTRLAVQNRGLAQNLVASPHFMGPGFSWGDNQISLCSIPATKDMGDSTAWIAIDSNHHIHAVVAEVYEHQRQVTERTARTQTEM